MNNDIIINAEMCDANDTIFIENEDNIMSIEFINNDAIIVKSAVIDLGILEI